MKQARVRENYRVQQNEREAREKEKVQRTNNWMVQQEREKNKRGRAAGEREKVMESESNVIAISSSN